ncbi:hypothetical protein HZS_7371, partial [Henneguya salminicola]
MRYFILYFTIRIILSQYYTPISIPELNVYPNDCCVRTTRVEISCFLKKHTIKNIKILKNNQILKTKEIDDKIGIRSSYFLNLSFKYIQKHHEGIYQCVVVEFSGIEIKSKNYELKIYEKQDELLKSMPVIKIASCIGCEFVLSNPYDEKYLKNYNIQWGYVNDQYIFKSIDIFHSLNEKYILNDKSLFIKNLTHKFFNELKPFKISCLMMRKISEMALQACPLDKKDLNGIYSTILKYSDDENLVIIGELNQSLYGRVGEKLVMFCPLVSRSKERFYWRFIKNKTSKQYIDLLFITNYLIFDIIDISISGEYICYHSSNEKIIANLILHVDEPPKILAYNDTVRHEKTETNILKVSCPIESNTFLNVSWWYNGREIKKKMKDFYNFVDVVHNKLIVYYKYLHKINIFQCFAKNYIDEETAIIFLSKENFIESLYTTIIYVADNTQIIIKCSLTSSYLNDNYYWVSYPAMKALSEYKEFTIHNNILLVSKFNKNNQFLMCVSTNGTKYYENFIKIIDIAHINILTKYPTKDIYLGENIVIGCYFDYSDQIQEVKWYRNNKLINGFKYKCIFSYDQVCFELMIENINIEDETYFTCEFIILIGQKIFKKSNIISLKLKRPPVFDEILRFNSRLQTITWNKLFTDISITDYFLIEYTDMKEEEVNGWYTYAICKDTNIIFLDRMPPGIDYLGFRISACNNVGCSKPTNIVKTYSLPGPPSLSSYIKNIEYGIKKIKIIWNKLPNIELSAYNGSYLVFIKIKYSDHIEENFVNIDKNINYYTIHVHPNFKIIWAKVISKNSLGIYALSNVMDYEILLNSKDTPFVYPIITNFICDINKQIIEWDFPKKLETLIQGTDSKIKITEEDKKGENRKKFIKIKNPGCRSKQLNLETGTLNIISIAAYTEPMQIGPYSICQKSCRVASKNIHILQNLNLEAIGTVIIFQWELNDDIDYRLFYLNFISTVRLKNKNTVVHQSIMINVEKKQYYFNYPFPNILLHITYCLFQLSIKIGCKETNIFTSICNKQSIYLLHQKNIIIKPHNNYFYYPRPSTFLNSSNMGSFNTNFGNLPVYKENILKTTKLYEKNKFKSIELHSFKNIGCWVKIYPIIFFFIFVIILFFKRKKIRIILNYLSRNTFEYQKIGKKLNESTANVIFPNCNSDFLLNKIDKKTNSNDEDIKLYYLEDTHKNILTVKECDVLISEEDKTGLLSTINTNFLENKIYFHTKILYYYSIL